MFHYHPEQNLLKDKVILVTGAGDGIGKEAAKTYAKYGASVILLGRTVSKLEKVYDDIIANGGATPAIVPMDLKGASEIHYRGLAETIEGQFKTIDGILHNAACLSVCCPFEHIQKNEFDEIMQVNVTAQYQLTKTLLPILKQSDMGTILFTSSSVGKQGRAFWGAYSISKFATEGMMQVLADEMENTSTRINAINPGATRTNMRKKALPGENSADVPEASTLMPLYLYLMGKDSRHIHGQSIDAKTTNLLR